MGSCLLPAAPANAQAKNRHVKPGIYPQHRTSRPAARSHSLCIKLHVLFRQPKKLSSVQKPLVLSACRALQRLARQGCGGVTQGFSLSTIPQCPSDFFSSLLSAHFHLCRGSAFELASTTSPHPPPFSPPFPLPTLPLSCTAACATLIHWCRYKQRF